MSWTQSHWGPLEDAPPHSFRLLIPHFLLYNGFHCQVGTRSLTMFIITVLITSLSRHWVHQDHTFLAPEYVVLTLPPISAVHVLAHYHAGHSPYQLSGQSEKSTPWCQWQYMPLCLASGNSPPVMPFQCYPVTHLLPPSLLLGTLLHCWWECKLVQPLWRTVWRFLKKLEIELPYDPAIPLLGIHTEETRIERDMYTPMFIAALFIIARTWKQPRCPSADEWIRKLWYIYTMEYYLAIKKNAFESVLMKWMNLEPIMQGEVREI